MTARSLLEQLKRDLVRRSGGAAGVLGVKGLAERMRKKWLPKYHADVDYYRKHGALPPQPMPPTREELEQRLAQYEPGSLAHKMTERSLFYFDRVFIPGPPGEGGEWVLREPQTGD
ncbi:hypothetical protein NF681_07005 [Comamonadaceae bacterium OTU4NAUVB1]|nr:hypothetical protein NF681_07005 [Comamonadaceae bacterium OTU4NAUVB1]